MNMMIIIKSFSKRKGKYNKIRYMGKIKKKKKKREKKASKTSSKL